MKKNNRLLICIIMMSAALASSGCYFFPEEEALLEPPALQADSSDYMTYTVKRGNLSDQSVYTGYVTAAAEYELSFENASGKLEKICVKAGESVKKGQLIAKLDTKEPENELSLQRLYVEKAKIAFEKVKTESSNSADIETARLNLEIEQKKLESYQSQIDSSNLYAPADGLISFADTIASGEYIESRKTLVKIIDSSKITVKYENSSVSQFSVGQNVNLRYDGKLYPGVISEISEQVIAEGAVNSVYATFTVEMPSVDAIGKIGDIIVVRDSRENVITLAKQMIKTYDGKNYVYVLSNGERVQRFIELGMEGGTEVEITSGLSEGELVIIG